MRRLRRWHHIDIREALRPILLFASSVFSVVCRPSKTDALAPRPAHRKALARTLRWIAANVDSGLTFHRRDRFYINPVVDASHGREPHATSTIQANSRSGGFILVVPALIFIFAVRKYLFAMWGIANR